MHINLKDIKRRSTSLRESSYIGPSAPAPDALNGSNIRSIEHSIAHYKTKLRAPHGGTAFDNILNIFEAACDYGDTNIIERTANLIVEEVLPAAPVTTDLKTAEATRKRKLTIATKTKVVGSSNKNQEELKDLISKARSNFDDNLAKTKNLVVKAGLSKDAKKESMDLCKYWAYDWFEETANMYSTCDRILRNYNKFSRRFDIDKLISESSYHPDGISGTVLELCQYIDTYEGMTIKSKYNVAIETAMYLSDKYNLRDTEKSIVEAASDYFIFTEDDTYKTPTEKYNALYESALDNCLIDKTIVESVFVYDSPKVPSDKLDVHSIMEAAKNPEDEVEKMIKSFKDKESKTIPLLKRLVEGIFSKSENQILDNMPNIFYLVRAFFVVGALAINPILAIILFITDKLISTHLGKANTGRCIKLYKKEIEKTKKAIDRSKSEYTKKRLTAYKDALEKNLDKLNTYYDETLHSKMDDEEAPKSLKDTLLDDDGDDEFSSLEHAIYAVDAISSIVQEYSNGFSDSFLNLIKSKIDSITESSELTDNITKYATMNWQLIDLHKLEDIYKDAYYDCKKHPNNYLKLSILSNQINTIRYFKPTDDIHIDETASVLAYEYVVEALSMIEARSGIAISEASFTNTINVAKTKLSNLFTKFSEKDKTISRDIDVSLDGVRRGAEDFMSGQSRESIIRGSVVPKASKIIKTAIVGGAAWLVNPAIAVIGAIGYIAVSKKCRAKERQFILDELEIELKMCEKYIQIAEDKNDLKAVKNLLTTKKKLEREKSRIKYRMLTVYKQRDNNDLDRKGDED